MAAIGLIGVGLMGHGIGRNLMRAGHSLTVVAHHNRKGVDSLVSLGATEAGTARELAVNSDVILTCVTGSPQLASAAAGPDGFVAGLRTGHAFIDCTTGEPDIVLDFANRLGSMGVDFADAPLARTPIEAESGKLNSMVGATPDFFARIKPILDAFCENIFHVGAAGAGTRMKLVNNLITMGQAALIAEAVTACRATGVDLKVFYDIISKGGGNSGIFQLIMPGVVERDDFDGMGFSIANAAKDLGYFGRMAKSAGFAAPMGAAVNERLEHASNQGSANELVGHLVKVALVESQLHAEGKKLQPQT